jgi:hypothetical protein
MSFGLLNILVFIRISHESCERPFYFFSRFCGESRVKFVFQRAAIPSAEPVMRMLPEGENWQ